MGSAIRLAFSEFLVFNLQHMAKEELLLNNLLWKYYTDEQLQSITQKIIAHLPQDTIRKNNTWKERLKQFLEETSNMRPAYRKEW